MNDTKHEAAMHGPQPMSDEALEYLRAVTHAGHDLTASEVRPIIAEVDRLRELTKAQTDLLAATANREAVAWEDSAGDVWTFPGDGSIGYSHETAPTTRARVEHKWGPLVPLVRDHTGKAGR